MTNPPFPIDDQLLQAELELACNDADVSCQLFRILAAEEVSGGSDAEWLPPHAAVPDDLEVAARANALGTRELHRVLIVPERAKDLPTLAALIRHEVEHGRQWIETDGRVLGPHDLARDVLSVIAGGLDGCAGLLLNSLPVEMDCNAAASVYVWRRFSHDELAPLLNDDRRRLVCSRVPPQHPRTLRARSVAFMFIHRQAAEKLGALRCQHGAFTIPQLLGTYDASDLCDFWDSLTSGE